MSRLVDDLLFLARSDSGALSMDHEYLPVGLLVNRLVAPAQALTRSYGIPLVTDMSGEGHVIVDLERISQAVLILIDNATKFTPIGEDISLATRSDATMLWIEVRDKGPGIPEADLPLIFERFYQVQETGARKRSGAGLGLSIAKSIVDAHGGTIAAESCPDHGTTFSIALPLVNED
jgi:two-component system sensor histidine kinase VicK